MYQRNVSGFVGTATKTRQIARDRRLRRVVPIQVIEIVVNGRPVKVGKLLLLDDRLIFHRGYDYGTAHFRKWDSLSFDRRVADYLRQVRVGGRPVREIHYTDKRGKFWAVDFRVFLEKSIEGNWGEGDQLYLAMDLWREIDPYNPGWTSRVRRLEEKNVESSKKESFRRCKCQEAQ